MIHLNAKIITFNRYVNHQKVYLKNKNELLRNKFSVISINASHYSNEF